MKHLTKIFVGLAIVLFIVGYYLQATDHDSQGIKLLLAAIMFMICAFINRHNAVSYTHLTLPTKA